MEQHNAFRQRDHAVTFYDSEATLIEELVQFAGEGLLAHESVLVIATPAHAAALREALLTVAIDVDRAESANQLRFADAESLLQTFMRGDEPVNELFQHHVSALLQSARASGQPAARLRVLGEMVSVLWQAGHREAAIVIEDLWDEVACRTGIALLCAYQIDNMHEQRLLPQFQALCSKHVRVAQV